MSSRVISRPVTGWIDPEAAFLALFASSARSFWLDTGPMAEAGFSYLGDATDLITSSVTDRTVTRDAAGIITIQAGSVFDVLRERLASPEPVGVPLVSGEFAPGWVGWLGYELGSQTVATPVHDSRYPDAALLLPARMLVFDHAGKTVTAMERREPSTQSEPFDWLEALSAADRVPPLGQSEPRNATWRHSAATYADLITDAQAEIRRGNAYQLCLTNEIRVDGTFDPVEVYRRLRQASPSHHGGLIRADGVALVSSSPEQFLKVTPGGTVTTRPIKGTRPRGVTPEHDSALGAELLSSDKERAENLMIVDLMRNDLGRVAVTGSVSVTQLLAVESYAQVHQLVSTVTAQLAPGISGVDAVESAFPAGSMTGAPKVSAMTILDRLESGPRGVYSGAFGYFGADGAIDLAMVIRSILIDATGASIGTGGGITALSVAEDEIEETRVKAAALLSALGASEQSVG